MDHRSTRGPSLRLRLFRLRTSLSWCLPRYVVDRLGQWPKHNDLEKSVGLGDGTRDLSPKSEKSVLCPYDTFRNIALHLTGHTDQLVSAHILQVLQPSAMGCDMVVELSQPAFKGRCMLRMCDRRFATQYRAVHNAAPWSPSIEGELRDLDATGDVERLFDEWHGLRQNVGSSWLDDAEWQRWSLGKQEAYLQWLTSGSHEPQGPATAEGLVEGDAAHTAKRLGAVWATSSAEGNGDRFNPHLDIPGFLTECTAGAPEPDLPSDRPR